MSYRWHRRPEQVTHGDDWLLTYADVITLLLCMFAVVVSLSVPRAKEVAPTLPPPPPVTIDAPVPQPPLQQEWDAAQPFQGNTPFHTVEIENESEREPMAEVPAPAPEVQQRPVEAVPEPKGDRLTTLEMDSAAFFDRGSATLRAEGKNILQDIAVRIQSEDYKGYQVTVEGHTDETPIKTAQFPSNWELSTARASAVVHFFLDQGIPAQRLRAAGYADAFPKVPNRDGAGNLIPQNQAQNRRVVIKLEKIEKMP